MRTKIISFIAVIILLTVIFQPVVSAGYSNTVTKKDELIIDTDEAVKDAELKGKANKIKKINLADRINATKFSNYASWDHLIKNTKKAKELFGEFYVDYQTINANNKFEIINSSSKKFLKIHFIPPFSYIENVSLWLCRELNNTEIKITFLTHDGGNIIKSFLINDSYLPYKKLTKLTFELKDYTETGLQVITFTGIGILSSNYSQIGIDYEYDIQPEIEIYNGTTKLQYIIKFFSYGLKTLAGRWSGSDTPPSAIRITNYYPRNWSNVFQLVTFQAGAIASGASKFVIRLPWQYFSDYAFEYKFAIYQVDSFSLASISIRTGGSFEINPIVRPVLISFYDMTLHKDHFFTDTYDFSHDVQMTFLYVLVYCALYPGNKYIFVSSVRSPSVHLPYLLITESDICTDNVRKFFLNTNSTNLFEMPGEPEMSLIAMAGMSSGITGYAFRKLSTNADQTVVEWKYPIGPSNDINDHFTFMMPFDISGYSPVGKLWASITIKFYNINNTLLYSAGASYRIDNRYFIFSFDINDPKVLHVSYVLIKIKFKCYEWPKNYFNYNSSIGFWLYDANPFGSIVSDNNMTYQQTIIYESDPKRKYMLYFMPYAWIRWTDGELITFNISNYTHLGEEGFINFYMKRLYDQQSFPIKFAVNMAIWFYNMTKWFVDNIVKPGVYTLYTIFKPVLDVLEVIGKFVILLAIWLYTFISYAIPIAIALINILVDMLVLFVGAITYGFCILTFWKFSRGLEIFVTKGQRAMVDYYAQFTSKLRTILTAITVRTKGLITKLKPPGV